MVFLKMHKFNFFLRLLNSSTSKYFLQNVFENGEKGSLSKHFFFIEDCAQILRHKKFMHYFTSITYTKSGRKSFLLLDLE